MSFKSEKLDKLQLVLSIMKKGVYYSRAELLELSGIEPAEWKPIVDELLEARFIDKIGERRTTQYFKLFADFGAVQQTSPIDSGTKPKQAASTFVRRPQSQAQLDLIDVPQLQKPRTAIVRPSSSTSPDEKKIVGSKGLNLPEVRGTNDAKIFARSHENNEFTGKRYKAEFGKRERDTSHVRSNTAKEASGVKHTMERPHSSTSVLLGNTPYGLPVTGNIKQQIAATTTGRHKTVFVKSSKSNFNPNIAPVSKPSSNNTNKISEIHPALLKTEKQVKRPAVRENRPQPLPIFAFRSDLSGRYEISENDLREKLAMTEEQQIIPLLSSNRVSQQFWRAFSALANCGGGYILLGVRRQNDNSFFVKGVRQHRELLENIREKSLHRELISEFPAEVKLVKTIRLCKKNVVCVSVHRDNLSQRPVFVGFDSFSKKPTQGCFIVKNKLVEKCSEEECKALWLPFLGKFSADWEQSSALKVSSTGKHRALLLSQDESNETLSIHKDSSLSSSTLHKTHSLRPPLLNADLKEKLYEIAEPAHSFQRLPISRLCEITADMCRLACLSTDQIATLLNRRKQYIEQKIIPRLLTDPRIFYDEASELYYCLK